MEALGLFGPGLATRWVGQVPVMSPCAKISLGKIL